MTDEQHEAVLAAMVTESGVNLLTLAQASPVLLVLLRHFGCTFCRQALGEVAAVRAELEARGVRPVFVHLGTPERAKPYFDHYGLSDVERISDPDASIYQNSMFKLGRTHPLSHFARPVVWAGWLSGGLWKHGFSPVLREDAHQMPGVFFLRDAKVVRSHRFRSIADQPDYVVLTA